MLVIRLQRTGRENLPTYRLVVAEKARPVKGKFMEIVGLYLPARDPVVFEHKNDRIDHWVKKGAIPSDTVARLLKRAGMPNMEKYIHRYAKQVSKKAQSAPPAGAPAATPTPVATDAAPEAKPDEAKPAEAAA